MAGDQEDNQGLVSGGGDPRGRVAPVELGCGGNKMNYDRPRKPTFEQARKSLNRVNISLRRTIGSELRVAFCGVGAEVSAYYTEDVLDALRTGRKMAEWRKGQ